MSAVRRSARATRKINYTLGTALAYPEGKPTTDFERRIAALNLQAFPSSTFAEVDDILVYALFASKRRQRSYRACEPDTAFYDAAARISKEDGITIRRIYGIHTDGGRGVAGINDACQALILELPTLFRQETLSLLQQ